MKHQLTVVCALLISLSLIGVCHAKGKPQRNSGAGFIDTHNHLFGGRGRGTDYIGAAKVAVKKMKKLGIQKMIIMPPPRSISNPVAFSMNDLLPVVKKFPGRFFVMGGGGVLNLMLHEADINEDGKVDPDLEKKFEKKAREILSKGAIGFGEFAVQHFSLNHGHPYESVQADHPLLLLLADIAAEHDVPIDIHMEAVPEKMDLPERKILTRSGLNPDELDANIPGFERLLSHNPKAKIIWAHAGWCNTGKRTANLCRKLLQRHSNLYMSFKLSPESVSKVRLIGNDKQSIKPEWLKVISEFPDRFVMGTDQFYGPPGSKRIGPQKTEAAKLFISLLPPELLRKVAIDNPRKLFNMD